MKDLPSEDEGTDSDQSYEDIELGPTGSKHELMDDEDLPNGYVHLVKKKQKKKTDVVTTPEENVETNKLDENGA